MSDYEFIARIIRHTAQDIGSTATPGDLARAGGLSLAALDRLCARWAGTEARRLGEVLSLAHSRQRLEESERPDANLRGCRDVAAASPHGFPVVLETRPDGGAARGAGWTLRAGLAESPFGAALIAESPEGLCFLGFVDDGGEDTAWNALHATWPGARVRRDDARAQWWAKRIFARHAVAETPAPVPLVAAGTAFQVRVWRSLLEVPPGALVSYAGLAKRAGLPAAARAVGSAVGRNPLSWLIPCHRVIRSGGLVRDYRWGAIRKRAMVAWEMVQLQAPISMASPLPPVLLSAPRRVR